MPVDVNSRLRIFFTSDTHGQLFPIDYATGKPTPGGLLAYAAQVEKDGDTLVIDGGDSLQGTPLVDYYRQRVSPCSADPALVDAKTREALRAGGPSPSALLHPVAESFKASGLDYFTLGNHDFNFGYAPLAEYLNALAPQAVCVCANVEDVRGELPIKTFAVRRLACGLRVGITGVVTHWVNFWESAHGGPEGVRVSDPLEAARSALVQMRNQCDVSICIYHGGFEEDLATGEVLETTGENMACLLARELDFDLLLTGHQHREITNTLLEGTYCVQPGFNAHKYVLIEGSASNALPGNTAHPLAFTSQLCGVGDACVEEAYRALLPLEEATQGLLDVPVGELVSKIPAGDHLQLALHGNPLATLINAAQLEEVRKEMPACDLPLLSCTAFMNALFDIPCQVTGRVVTSVYPFQNSLVVLKMSGETLRALLERCADYFDLDEQSKPCIAQEFTSPKLRHYNHDFYAGLNADIDITRPAGERVVSASLLGGEAIDPAAYYLMAMSDYRSTGTCGYEMLRACEVVWTSPHNVPEIITNYIASRSPVNLPDLGTLNVGY